MKTALDSILTKKPLVTLSPQEILLTRQEAADVLGLQPNTLAVWQCTKRYNLPSVKVGRLRKYRLSDLQAFIQNNAEAE
jgi:hypothetical protein